MEKIKTLTKEEFDKIKLDRVSYVKKLLDLKGNFALGDTSVRIDNSSPCEVYKSVNKIYTTYYIVIFVIDEETAFAYSLYPR